ncbi:MAG: hypothetical protein WCZ65_03645 [Lysobacteraceae bacterium]
MTFRRFALVVALACAAPTLVAVAQDADAPADRVLLDFGKIPGVGFPALDLESLAAEDTLRDIDQSRPMRFAIAHPLDVDINRDGVWHRAANGDFIWQYKVFAKAAAHLNFGFEKVLLPAGARLDIVAADGESALGPYVAEDIPEHGRLWTPVLGGEEAVLQLRVPAQSRAATSLILVQLSHGYRGFGRLSKACKSGSCNTDVACLSPDDPWNAPRRSVGAYTLAGTDYCTGSLVNNTANDRRMLFATATHCEITSNSAAQQVRVYWNYESPTCRVPGSSASGNALPKPNTTSQGLRLIAATNNPWGSGAAGTRSDFTLIELETPPVDNTFNLHWAGWDRRPPPTPCAAPGDTASTAGLCASIHHPGVDEKRITFVEVPMTQANIAGAQGVHWLARWDPTPPRLPNIVPMPGTLPASVTEGGSSGSPLYNAERRFIGVLSGGASFCGATGSSLSDQYGGLFHAWEGLNTAATRVKDHLDPLGKNPEYIDGIDACTPPPTPTGLVATATAPNQISLNWSPVTGADHYRVFRATGGCPASGYVEIAQTTSPAYVDTSVSGGTTYSYRIAAHDEVEACTSPQGACASALASGTCALPPTFAGLASASSAGSTGQCGINLQWNAASANCGVAADLRYNVYRSTTPGFTPSAGNLLASCLSATSLVDTDEVGSGVAQHYLVRAEDISGQPANGRCGGVEDGNLLIRSAAAFGPDIVTFTDDVENGPDNWTASGSGAGSNFAIVTTAANSPTRSWFVPDPSAISDRHLAINQPFDLAPGSNAVLSFAHRYATENNFDGAVLEYSVDGGSTWADILDAAGGIPANPQRFLAGGYNGTISTSYSNPLGGRPAWTGNSGVFISARVDLSDFGGQSLLIRFRFASDTSQSSTGWWIDDIGLTEGTSCQAIDPDLIFADGFE